MCVLGSFGVVVGTILMVLYRHSNFRYLQHLEAGQPHALARSYSAVNSGVTSTGLVSNLPLFVFWGGIGLVTYWCAMSILRAFKQVAELEQEMNYVNANRQELIHEAFTHVGVRVMVMLVWFLYLQATIHIVVPYAIAVAYAASGAHNLFYGAGYVLWGMGVLAVALHLHTILLRLVFLRPRLFGGELN